MDHKRKRGGQPGNQNALKHGFYSTAMHKGEIQDLEKAANGVADEIKLMRVVIRRVAILAREETNRTELLELLSTLGAAGVRLASMLRTQKVYFEEGEQSMFRRALSEAIEIAVDEIRRDPEDGPGLD